MQPHIGVTRAHTVYVDEQLVHLSDFGVVGGQHFPTANVPIALGDLEVLERRQWGDPHAVFGLDHVLGHETNPRSPVLANATVACVAELPIPVAGSTVT